MGFKTILVPTAQYDLMNSTLETALLLARDFDSYIEGFASRFAMPAALAMGGVGVLPVLASELEESDRQSKKLFQSFMQEHGVLYGEHKKALSSNWLENAPEDEHFVGSHGRVFDVIVLGKPGRDPKGPRM